ncbi:hypothetical protein JZK55_22610 [Dissulfurispira thermophila]|uniref:Uncharacterized protein n=2 Tax=root TaxID=1 RepID=A0A7G1H521_9BACT|nr:hypothetical protein [Dissulfurispira thermophila]BCB97339.1 hypothetical protein JZK55_22610 [Dissulfurispira thermophila]
MSLLCLIDNLNENHEIIICDSAVAKHAHKELFRYKDNAYVTVDNTENVFDAISNTVNLCNAESNSCPSKIHLVLNWLNLLKVSLWRAEKPTQGDIFTLLKNIGVGSHELQPFRTSDLNDIFPWLYYGKRFDILRKLCHKAKKQMETHLKNHSIRVDCHLIAEDTKRIVASSL